MRNIRAASRVLTIAAAHPPPSTPQLRVAWFGMMTPNVCRRRFGIRDAKRLNRERETLIRETTRLVNRMKACLVRFGVSGLDPTCAKLRTA